MKCSNAIEIQAPGLWFDNLYYTDGDFLIRFEIKGSDPDEKKKTKGHQLQGYVNCYFILSGLFLFLRYFLRKFII